MAAYLSGLILLVLLEPLIIATLGDRESPSLKDLYCENFTF